MLTRLMSIPGLNVYLSLVSFDVPTEGDSSVVMGGLNILWISSHSKLECLISEYYTYFKGEEPGYIEGK